MLSHRLEPIQNWNGGFPLHIMKISATADIGNSYFIIVSLTFKVNLFMIVNKKFVIRVNIVLLSLFIFFEGSVLF